MTLPYPPPFMDLATLAEHICLSESTIETHVRQGAFPAPRRQGGKRLWRWKDVERHLAGEDTAGASSILSVEEIKNATRAAANGH